MVKTGPLGFEPRTSGSAGRCHNPYSDDEPLSMLFSGLLHSWFYYLNFARRVVVCAKGEGLTIARFIAKDFEAAEKELDENCDR